MAWQLELHDPERTAMAVGFHAGETTSQLVSRSDQLDGSWPKELIKATEALLGEGLAGVLVAALQEADPTPSGRRKALLEQLPALVPSNSCAGIVLAGLPWIDEGVDYLATAVEALQRAFPGWLAYPPLFVRATIRQQPTEDESTLSDLALQLGRLVQVSLASYPVFPKAPLAFAIASSGLSSWGTYCGSGSLMQGLRRQRRPPVAGVPAFEGGDKGFPYRLSPIGPYPAQELARRRVAVLDTTGGSYRWQIVQALNTPEHVDPHTTLQIQDLLRALQGVSEQILVGQPLTADRRVVFEQQARALVQAHAASFAEQSSVAFAYHRETAIIRLTLHIAAAVVQISAQVHTGG